MMSILIPPMIIASLILFISRTTMMATPPTHEKASPFECGFDPKNSARIPFSSRYFLLAVFFLIFDIETIILLPLPLVSSLPAPQMLSIFMFIVILLLGLLHEWREGSLSWSKYALTLLYQP